MPEIYHLPKEIIVLNIPILCYKFICKYKPRGNRVIFMIAKPLVPLVMLALGVDARNTPSRVSMLWDHYRQTSSYDLGNEVVSWSQVESIIMWILE